MADMDRWCPPLESLSRESLQMTLRDLTLRLSMVSLEIQNRLPPKPQQRIGVNKHAGIGSMTYTWDIPQNIDQVQWLDNIDQAQRIDWARW